MRSYFPTKIRRMRPKKVRTEGTDFYDGRKRGVEDQEIEKKSLQRHEVRRSMSRSLTRLASGEISDVIGADGKYYILRCVSDYDEAATKIRKRRDGPGEEERGVL